ncbi:MAG: hypothetical protein K0U98_10500 [Deltaproteobacteria bacterium]|nr:hypothetical protein [Deltaproteobacteria bacterium]
MIDSLLGLSSALGALPFLAWLIAVILFLPLPLSFFLQTNLGVEVDEQKIRRLRWTLIATSVAYTGMHLVFGAWQWQLLSPSGLQPTGWRSVGPVLLFGWQPWLLLVLLGRELRGSSLVGFPGGRKRAASLTPRASTSPVPLIAWIPGWVAWAGVALWLVASSGEHGLLRWVPWLTLACAALLFLSGPGRVKAALVSEVEPYPPGGEESIAKAYDQHRKRTGWMMFRCHTFAGLGNLLFALDLASTFGGRGFSLPLAVLLGVYSLLEGAFYFFHRQRIKALQQLILAGQLD